MPKSDKRVKITLECTECKRRNYITMKSKINDRERLEMNKYCSHERRHTLLTHEDRTVRGCPRGMRWYAGNLPKPRAVAQLVEHRSPKPTVGGSSPSCPASTNVDDLADETAGKRIHVT
jgi:large subunit ribosomal protein L33